MALAATSILNSLGSKPGTLTTQRAKAMAEYSADIVKRVVAHVWKGNQREAALAILDLVSGYGGEAARARLQVAAIKLSGGSLKSLEDWVQSANGDFRDVLAAAEYPGQFEAGFLEPSDPKQVKLGKADLTQYELWLKRVGADDVEPFV